MCYTVQSGLSCRNSETVTHKVTGTSTYCYVKVVPFLGGAFPSAFFPSIYHLQEKELKDKRFFRAWCFLQYRFPNVVQTQEKYSLQSSRRSLLLPAFLKKYRIPVIVRTLLASNSYLLTRIQSCLNEGFYLRFPLYKCYRVHPIYLPLITR